MTLAQEALHKAALYLSLFESHSQGLKIHSPNIYQFMASELTDAAESPYLRPIIEDLAKEHNTIAEILETQDVSAQIEVNRARLCPELDALMNKLTTTTKE